MDWERLIRDQNDALARTGSAKPPATYGEIWDAEWKANGLDTTFGVGKPVQDAYDEFQQRLTGITGKSLPELAQEHGIELAERGFDGKVESLGRIVDALPDTQQKLLADYKDVRGRARQKAAEIERERAEIAGRTYGLPAHGWAFAASVARQMVDPVNIVTAPLGGPARGPVLKWLGKEFLLGAGVQAAQEPFIAPRRQDLGLESNSIENIIQAGIGQAGLAGLLHAGAAALRAYRARGLPEPPELAGVDAGDLGAAARQAEADAAFARMGGDPSGARIEQARAALETGAPIEPMLASRGTGVDLSRPRPMSLADGRKIDVQYMVVDLASVRASHLADGTPNPDFPALLQPRDREAAASQRWVQETAARLDPERLGLAPTAQEGAPVVAPDGVVESGNGRVMAIAEAYARHPERAAEYRAYLDELGFDTAALERPVLVRARQNTFTPEERIAFTREANVAQTASLAPAERAKIDAGKLDEGVLALWQGGAPGDLKNAPFVQRFKALAVDRGEAASFDPDGRISRPGAERIRAALVARAWREEDLVRKLSEDLGDTSKSIVDAMIDTAPDAARLRAAVEEGRLAAEFDVVSPMIRAFRTIEHARRTGKKLSALVDQGDIERGMMPEADRAAIRMFFLDDGFTLAAGAETVAGRIRAAIGDALMQQQEDMFGGGIASAGLLKAARFADEPLGDAPISALERAKARTEAAVASQEPKAGDAPARLPAEYLAAETRFSALMQGLDPDKPIFDFGREDTNRQPVKSSAREEMDRVKKEAQAAAELQDCVARTVAG